MMKPFFKNNSSERRGDGVWRLIRDRRTLVITLIAVAMNSLLYLAVSRLNLPLWLDTVGTAYAALLLGPFGGVIPAVVNGFFLAAFFFGWDSTAYVIVSVLISLLVGWASRTGRIRDVLSCAGLVTVVFLFSVMLCVFLSFRLAADGNPGDYWGDLLYRTLRPEFGAYLAAVFSTLLTKAPDTVAGALLTAAAWFLTPRKWRSRRSAPPPSESESGAPEDFALPLPWLGDSRHETLKIPKEK